MIQRVNAELTAGSTPGNNILQVTITESPPFHLGVTFANNQSTSVGSEQGSVFLAHDNNVETLQLIPFFDIGTAWNNRGINADPQTIASLGLGLNWQPFNGLVLRADYGIPLAQAIAVVRCKITALIFQCDISLFKSEI
ncbi:MAG: hypothetical protein V7K44_09140 [Nostoc sp.]